MVHAVVALAPLPVMLSLAAGYAWPTVLVAVGLLLGGVGVAVRGLRPARRCRQAQVAAERDVAVVVDDVYEQWLTEQVRRGGLELDRWRRTLPR